MPDSDSDYFESQTHNYLELSWDELSDYIFRKLDFHKFFKGKHTAIEIGPGSGRFTQPLIDNFQNVILVEPSRYFCDILNSKYTSDTIHVINESLETYLEKFKRASSAEDGNIYLFGFHLLHHLGQVERDILYTFIQNTKSLCFLVDPYYLNPLILIQILITPEMKFKEEYKYLKINRRSLKKELKPFNLKLLSYKPIVPIAPFIIQKLLVEKQFTAIALLERLASFLPFLFSYHAYIISPGKNEHP